MIDWSQIMHFNINEQWGEVSKIDVKLVKLLDQFRDLLGESVYVLCGTQGTHVANSFHTYGMAVDVCFPQRKTPLFEIFLMATRYRFGGIGLYPNWCYHENMIGGLHLDIRPTEMSSRWLGVKHGDKTNYLPINLENLKTYNLLR